MLCELIGRYHHFRGTYCLHLQGWTQPWRWGQYVPPERWHLPASPHGITIQKTNVDSFARTTSNLKVSLVGRHILSHHVTARCLMFHSWYACHYFIIVDVELSVSRAAEMGEDVVMRSRLPRYMNSYTVSLFDIQFSLRNCLKSLDYKYHA
jgi:hypothetical protein